MPIRATESPGGVPAWNPLLHVHASVVLTLAPTLTPPPRSSWTNKLITAKDHRSVQINIGHLDESGLYTGSFSAFALTGQVRAKGDADSALDILWTKKRAELGQ